VVGNERVELIPATLWRRLVHHRIWYALLTEEGAITRFGPRKRRFGDPEDRRHRFLVRLGNEYIGVADIYENRQAEVCLFVLGLLPRYRRQKFGAVAARLMLRHAFEKLDARRVESSVLATNPASIEMQDGMVQEGVLRRRVLVDGKEIDELLFAMLRSEWNVARRQRERG
jgi:RimJ/RimL family protein N-acetyltransferase